MPSIGTICDKVQKKALRSQSLTRSKFRGSRTGSLGVVSSRALFVASEMLIIGHGDVYLAISPGMLRLQIDRLSGLAGGKFLPTRLQEFRLLSGFHKSLVVVDSREQKNSHSPDSANRADEI